MTKKSKKTKKLTIEDLQKQIEDLKKEVESLKKDKSEKDILDFLRKSQEKEKTPSPWYPPYPYRMDKICPPHKYPLVWWGIYHPPCELCGYCPPCNSWTVTWSSWGTNESMYDNFTMEIK